MGVDEKGKQFSDQLGSNVLDWQVGNWANDTTMLLQNTRWYKDVIAVESDPLWSWGWIGYYRLFKDQKNPHYIDIMKDLYFDIKADNKYRDAEENRRVYS